MRNRPRKSAKGQLLNNIILIVYFLCPVTWTMAQSGPFQKVYGGGSYDEGNAILQTDDEGFAIAGSSYSFGAGDYDGYLVKTDKTGKVLWSKTYGTQGAENFQDAVITSDKGYLLAGSLATVDFWGQAATAFFVVRTDENGQTKWSKQIPYSSNRVRKINPTGDGGFTLYGDDPYNIHFSKIDANGTTVFYNKYYMFVGSGIAVAGSAKPTTDGGYILTGHLRNAASLFDLFLMKVDANGILQWTKIYNVPNGSTFGSDLLVLGDGSIVVAGSAEGLGSELMDALLLKTDADGNLQWVHTYGGENEDKSKSLTATCDGGYLLTGNSKSFKNNINDLYVIKTDADGVLKWSKVYGGHQTDAGNRISVTAACDILITGTTQSYGAGLSDVFLLKLTDAGNDEENCNNPSVVSNYGTHTLNVSVQNVYNEVTMIPSNNFNITVTSTSTFTEPSVCNECRKPVADFDYVQNKMSLNFLNYSENGATYQWDLGDGTADTMQSPVYEYANTGLYQVKLIVTNACGKDSLTKSVQVVNTSDCIFSLQPGPSRGQDASINNSPGKARTNYSENAMLIVDHWTHDGIWDSWRSLLKFDLSSVCDVSHLLDSRLSLYYPVGDINYLHNYGNSFFISRINASWNDYAVTWKTQPTTSTNERILVPPTPWGSELLNQNVYQLTKDMVSEGNHGFMLQLQEENDAVYHAADYASSNFPLPEKRPLLQLTYIPLNSSVVFNDTTICRGDSIQLFASGGVKYKWYPSEGLSCDNCPAPKASPDQSVVYRVFIYNCENCAEVKKISVKLQSGPRIADTELIICKGDSVQLHADNSTHYTWTPAQRIDDPSLQHPTVWPSETTTYYVAGLNSSSACSDSVKVKVHSPIPSTLLDTTLCQGQQVALNVQQYGATYLWQDGTTNAHYEISEPGLYAVAITNACGTVEQEYLVEACCEEIKIPNLIIPNEDGLNDYFVIGCLGDGSWNMQVYNRWGTIVYESSDYKNNWDAAGLVDGVYYYSIHKKNKDPYKGWVQVMR